MKIQTTQINYNSTQSSFKKGLTSWEINKVKKWHRMNIWILHGI